MTRFISDLTAHRFFTQNVGKLDPSRSYILKDGNVFKQKPGGGIGEYVCTLYSMDADPKPVPATQMPWETPSDLDLVLYDQRRREKKAKETPTRTRKAPPELVAW